MPVYTGATTVVPLAVGAEGQVLTVDLGVPAWKTTGPVLTNAATGALPYYTSASTMGWLAAATNGYMLAMASGLPAWQPPPPSVPTAVAGAVPVYTTPSSISASRPRHIGLRDDDGGRHAGLAGAAVAAPHGPVGRDPRLHRDHDARPR